MERMVICCGFVSFCNCKEASNTAGTKVFFPAITKYSKKMNCFPKEKWVLHDGGRKQKKPWHTCISLTTSVRTTSFQGVCHRSHCSLLPYMQAIFIVQFVPVFRIPSTVFSVMSMGMVTQFSPSKWKEKALFGHAEYLEVRGVMKDLTAFTSSLVIR